MCEMTTSWAKRKTDLTIYKLQRLLEQLCTNGKIKMTELLLSISMLILPL